MPFVLNPARRRIMAAEVPRPPEELLYSDQFNSLSEEEDLEGTIPDPGPGAAWTYHNGTLGLKGSSDNQLRPKGTNVNGWNYFARAQPDPAKLWSSRLVVATLAGRVYLNNGCGLATNVLTEGYGNTSPRHGVQYSREMVGGEIKAILRVSTAAGGLASYDLYTTSSSLWAVEHVQVEVINNQATIYVRDRDSNVYGPYYHDFTGHTHNNIEVAMRATPNVWDSRMTGLEVSTIPIA